MRTILAILILVAVAGCSSTRAPFSPKRVHRIVAISVGEIHLGDYDPFAADENGEFPDPIPQFATYFTITDPVVVARLCSLVADVPKYEDGFIPMAGILSVQRYLDSQGAVLGETHIVNFGNTLVIREAGNPPDGYHRLAHSRPFCRIIFDLMCEHCPDKIEEQRKMYRRVNRRLETLLFEGKDIEESAQQDESTVPVKAAPSASSTVR